MRTRRLRWLGICLLLCQTAWAQYTVEGQIKNESGNPASDAAIILDQATTAVFTDESGYFTIGDVTGGSHGLIVFKYGYTTDTLTIEVPLSESIEVTLTELSQELEEVVINQDAASAFGIKRLNMVEGVGIYEAKKTEVIVVDKIQGNVAANTARQVYAKIPGLNIWENDGAGIQLGIGGRGLSPNRTSNFNVRQNGYDISADALGYPESYYTPPTLALKQIEIIRGAASLQYGTQFGGLLNFVMKLGPADDTFRYTGRLTGGSFGFINAFNSIGGQTGKLNYYAFHDYNHTNGWRPNSESDKHTAYGGVHYDLTDKIKVGLEYTFSQYLAHQPGGLTDAQFQDNPRQSNRARNWFGVHWNLLAHTLQYNVNPNLRFDYRVFHLDAGRDALGNLSRIDRPDDESQPRNLIRDRYTNWGGEVRMLKNFDLLHFNNTLVVGARYYHGMTHQQQGLANNSGDADFDFLNPERLEDSDFRFPGNNVALFAENIFFVNDHWSITPGLRYEYIQTTSDGYYRDVRSNLAGEVLFDSTVMEYRDNSRDFLLAGIGISYKPDEQTEFYGNLSQNYRAINFNDIRINNPSLRVDENLSDERGFNADLGFRSFSNVYNIDASLFLLKYNDRIGNILLTEPDPRFDNLVNRTVRFRTNLADAVITGMEFYGELDWFALFNQPAHQRLTTFLNLSLIYSEYLTDESQLQGNKVELVPPVNAKLGIRYQWKDLELGIQGSYVAEHFSDAANTPSIPAVPTAIEGTIPSYYVIDFSSSYAWKTLKIFVGVNNLTNNLYFTRRAAGYPGPGIIPSDARNVYLGLGWEL
uniref:TonB-dependent receptor n=1 Tax=Roseihalotalea indica TaxID=2867963 RepID=A0AA49GMN8_9BACT|nr:TonB-dependent receptor [Tunicatimonas sp. TK19036]